MLNKIKTELKAREHAKALETFSHIWTEALFWVSKAKLIPRTRHKLRIQTLRRGVVPLLLGISSLWMRQDAVAPLRVSELLCILFQEFMYRNWRPCGKTALWENRDNLNCRLSIAAHEPWLGEWQPNVHAFWNLPCHVSFIQGIKSNWSGTISKRWRDSWGWTRTGPESISPLCEQKVQNPVWGTAWTVATLGSSQPGDGKDLGVDSSNLWPEAKSS